MSQRPYISYYIMTEETTAVLGKEKSSDEATSLKTKKSIKKNTSSVMTSFFAESKNPPAIEDVVEGPVIAIDKSSVYIDLAPHGTGIIYGREFISARDVIRNVNIGDSIAAKVVDSENEDGYIELSLKEARQAIIWAEADAAIKNGTIFELTVKEANKGGLLIDWQGVNGFLPASQLKSENYPRVEDGDKEKILMALKDLVGQKMAVSIITAVPKEGKLIFSEKSPDKAEQKEMVSKYSVGDDIKGSITGIVDFGVFIKIEEGLEGLAHISELDWGLVEDPKQLFAVGDKVSAKIIEIKDGKISLSIKALKENPWKDAKDKYKKGQEVEGVIIKFNKHGALASIEEGVAGLVHISEFGGDDKLREALELGKSYKFKISLFEPGDRKMALSFPGAPNKSTEGVNDANEVEETTETEKE